jgi:group I intron endonuclease
MYSVYIHTFPNGKKYVGVTSWKPELRWGANGCNYKNPYMVNAIKKYGWDNITHEIVAKNLTVDQASEMEIELIKKYNSADKRYGYNISLGGVESKICSEQTKEKLRQANLGKVMSEESKRKIGEFNRGRHPTEEALQHMREAQKKSFANGNNAMHSPEARVKAAKKKKGKKLPDYITQKASEAKFHAVKNMQTGVIYPSIKAACEDTGIDQSTIIRHCKGKLKSKKWQYAEKINAEVIE